MYRIDDDRCVKCGLCIDACPSSAFVGTNPGKLRHSVVYESVALDQKLCTECGECVATEYWCPFEAVYNNSEPRPVRAPADGTKYSKYIYHYDPETDDYYARFAPKDPDGHSAPTLIDVMPWKWVTRLDGDYYPGCNFYCVQWVLPFTEQLMDAGHPPHVHKVPELIFVIGGDPENPEELGAEIEFYLGPEREKHIITKSCVMFMPALFPHGPWIPKKTTKPWLFIEVNQSLKHTEKGFNQVLPREVVDRDEGLEFFPDEGF